MGNIKHNRHLHSRVTEEGKHLFKRNGNVFNTDHREDKNASVVPRYLLMHFSPDEFFHMHTVLTSVSTKQFFLPSSPVKNFGCLVEMTLEGSAKWDEEKQDSCLIRAFLGGGKELCRVTATPLCPPPLHSQMGKGRVEGAMGGNSNLARHTNPSQMVMLKTTRNSNVELHRPPEKTDDLKQSMLCSKGILKMWHNCHSQHFFDRSIFC